MKITAASARRALAGVVALCIALALGSLPHSVRRVVSSELAAEGNLVHAHEPAADDAASGGPFVSLHLDEGSGTIAADGSGNGNNGTLLNGPAWATGKSGAALSFDGVDDTIYIANSSTLNSATTGITVTAWVYRAANQSGAVSVLSRQLGTTYYEHFHLGFEDNKYRWFVNTTSGYSDTTIGGPAPLGQWVHLAGTYDGTDVKLYANGVLQFSSPHSGTLSADITGITIGAGYNDGGHAPIEAFNGKIDEVNVYGQALTAQEVLQVYQATGAIPDAPPSVSITSPAAGTSVQGTVSVAASAGDDVGVGGVQFLVDGSAVGPEDTSAPFTTTIDTYLYREGQHTLTAVARDSVGNLAVSPAITVTFDNIAIMPLGDSLTYGYVSEGNPDNEVGGYRRYLWEKIHANGITNVNFVGSLANGIPTIDRDHEGHGGWRIDDIEAAVSGWVTASQPDIILLMAGTNDLNGGFSPELAILRMGLLLDKIHSFRPTARVLLLNLPGARANVSSDFSNVTPTVISAFNDALPGLVNPRAAQGWNIALVDAFGSAGLDRGATSNDYSSDGLHLSLAGYSKLANLLYSALNLSAFDSAAPSVPAGLTASAVSSSQINLSWSPSTDNVGVSGYQIFQNGVAIATTPGTAYQHAGLTPGTTYSYAVLAYDSANNQSGHSTSASAVTMAAPRITAFSSNVTFPVASHVPITFTATAASGGGSVQYKFVTFSATTGWLVGQDYSSSNTFTWFPPQGVNAVQVWIRGAGSSADYQDWTGTDLFDVVSTTARLTGFAPNVNFPVAPSTTITWTAAATAGTAPVSYRFVRFDWGANTWSVLRDWGPSNQVSWTPPASDSGWHAVQVWVRTAGSTVVYDDWRGSDYFLITSSTALTLTPSRTLTNMKVGDIVTWTANVAGAGAWEYKFITYDSIRGWILQQDYSTQNTFSWFPPSGSCAMQVWVRAVGSHTFWERYEGSGTFVVNP
jgi:lysophospholipase L1-like esterase